MKTFLFHSYPAQLNGQTRHVLSIFIAWHNVSAAEFDAALAEAATITSNLDAVHIVGYDDDVEKVRQWMRRPGDVSLERLRSLLPSHDENIRFIVFDAVLGRHLAKSVDNKEIFIHGLLGAEQHQTLLMAFREGGGEQRAPAGTHFSKTSKRHSDRFLRVSNVLEEGANVRLVAFWLMAHVWKVDFQHLIVDTSGIYSVASTVMHEAAVRGGLSGNPTLWSHRSYEGVKNIAPHEAATALFLVSASTSGTLVRTLRRQGANPERVVTLFLLTDRPVEDGKVLCDLRGHKESGLKPIDNHKEKRCPLCAKNFHLVHIQGDQFSITPPNVTLIEIKMEDLPSEWKPDLSSLLGLRSFYVYRRSPGDRICTLGLDVLPILAGPLHAKNRSVLKRKRDEWAWAIRRAATVSLRHVVACGYVGSAKIASRIAKDARAALSRKRRPSVVTPQELRSTSPEPNTSTIVISACVDQGAELLSVSRTLRDVQENGSTAYLAIATLLGAESERSRLRSNLTVGQHGAGTFMMHSLFTLPLECYEEEPSWGSELRELQRAISWIDRKGKDLPAELEHRIRRLTQAPATGLIDDLFWPTATDNALALRSDFTLIVDARRAPSATQADLFAVISLVLARLRVNPDTTRRLSHNAYERAVLSPHNFDRFNDGVLQACLLRAARPKELAYGNCDAGVSEQMLDILTHALPGNGVPEKSEALMEFVIALLTRRMTLHAKHLKEFCQALIAAAGESTTPGLLAMYMLEREEMDEAADLGAAA